MIETLFKPGSFQFRSSQVFPGEMCPQPIVLIVDDFSEKGFGKFKASTTERDDQIPNHKRMKGLLST